MSPRFALRARDHLSDPASMRRFTDAHFAEAAPRYDAVKGAMSLFRDRSWKEALAASLPPHPAPLCVDLACGTGDVTLLLLRRYPGGRVVAIDRSGPMIGIARRRTGSSRVAFVRGDLAAAGLPDGCADVVTEVYGLRYAPDPAAGLREIARILSPGGTAAVLDFSRSEKPLRSAAACGFLRAWGGFFGLLCHGSPEIHGYIGASLSAFPDRRRLRELFREAGLVLAGSRRFMFGITELYLLRKE